jgi:hypothetical protein
MARFRQRILDEGKVRFSRVRDSQRGLGQDFAADWTEHRLDFAQLARIAAGEDEFFHARILPRPLRVAAEALIRDREIEGFAAPIRTVRQAQGLAGACGRVARPSKCLYRTAREKPARAD